MRTVTQSISRKVICIPTLVFSFLNPKFTFGQIWDKKSKLPILAENLHIEYLEDADFYSDISFLSFQP